MHVYASFHTAVCLLRMSFSSCQESHGSDPLHERGLRKRKGMGMNEAQKRAIMKYEKANIKRVVLKLNKNTDQDIIAFLEAQKSVNGEIKRILREHIKTK